MLVFLSSVVGMFELLLEFDALDLEVLDLGIVTGVVFQSVVESSFEVVNFFEASLPFVMSVLILFFPVVGFLSYVMKLLLAVNKLIIQEVNLLFIALIVFTSVMEFSSDVAELEFQFLNMLMLVVELIAPFVEFLLAENKLLFQDDNHLFITLIVFTSVVEFSSNVT